MTPFTPGDRVCMRCTGDDGLPLVRYGFVGGCCHDDGTVTVMMDDELSTVVLSDPSQLEQVTVTSIELRLSGSDLLDDPVLRQGLIHLWRAEAELAGLDIDSIHSTGTGLRDSSESYVLAEMMSGAEQFVVRAIAAPNEPDVVVVRADRPNRWDF